MDMASPLAKVCIMAMPLSYVFVGSWLPPCRSTQVPAAFDPLGISEGCYIIIALRSCRQIVANGSRQYTFESSERTSSLVFYGFFNCLLSFAPNSIRPSATWFQNMSKPSNQSNDILSSSSDTPGSDVQVVARQPRSVSSRD